MCTFYSDIILIQCITLEYCFEDVPKHPQWWLPNVLSRRVNLLKNALCAVPSVAGYAIRCVLCNTIIIPNAWASHNINMSHMYIDLIQLHVIYCVTNMLLCCGKNTYLLTSISMCYHSPPPPGLPLYIWWHGWQVLQSYCKIVRAAAKHVYESAELRIIQRFETSQNTVRFCLFSRWNG